MADARYRMNKRLIRTSKFLAYVLRHDPGSIGLELDDNGWANVSQLVSRAQQHGKGITREIIREAVETNDKRRFSLSPDGTRIRARQGHSLRVDLELEPVEPPEHLYHGTASRFLRSILASGLEPRGRQHVHLSLDHRAAVGVGRRHGRPVVLKIMAGRMHREGASFYLSENGVWLTSHVPPDRIELDETAWASDTQQAR